MTQEGRASGLLPLSGGAHHPTTSVPPSPKGVVDLPGSRPEISVLVLAWDRVKFLRAALESIANQTLSAALFEVVVISNRSEAEVRASIIGRSTDHLDLRVVRCTDKKKGRFFAEGIRSTRGAILALLNDDDLWEPERLERVHDAFRTHPELGFYKNQVLFVDASANPTTTLGGYRRFSFFHRQGGAHLEPGTPVSTLSKVGMIEPSFNDSSIAIRKDVVLPQIASLEQLDASEDSFLYYCALVGRVGVEVDAKPLTHYSVHNDNSSIPLKTDEGAALAGLHQETARQIDTFRTILGMIRSSSRPELERLAQRDFAFCNVQNELQNPEFNRRRMVSRLGALLGSLRIYNWRLNALLVTFGGISLLAPTVVQRIYLRVHW